MICVNREAVAMITCWGKERILRGRKVVDDIIKQKVYEYITKKLIPDIDELIMFDCGEHGTITGTFVEGPDDRFDACFDTVWILKHEDGSIISLRQFLTERYQWKFSHLPEVDGQMTKNQLAAMSLNQLNTVIRENVKRVPLR